ncbi:MAG: GNAT family N-acetyltransferase, partial [Candidatus Zixiibacteriota bacterium]
MIRRCTESDLDGMYAIINDAAQAYKGLIPDDRWHEPYMPMEE